MENGAFCGRFFRGSILPVGEHCEPTGKIEPRKNLPQNPHCPCVSKRVLGFASIESCLIEQCYNHPVRSLIVKNIFGLKVNTVVWMIEGSGFTSGGRAFLEELF